MLLFGLMRATDGAMKEHDTAFDLAGRRSSMAAAATLAVCLGASLPALGGDVSNECSPDGQGSSCAVDYDCSTLPFATACVEQTCQIPCEDEVTGAADLSFCALGEACVAVAVAPGIERQVCRQVPFRMDLNLVDMCIQHFIEEAVPDLANANACSLERNLNRLLDQDGNRVFDIFDVDACIRSYAYDQSCTADGICPQGDVFCPDDAVCGSGAYCNTRLRRCERECGLLVTRQRDGPSTVERPCYGHLQTCDRARGRCEEQSPEYVASLRCELDGDCPSGAYCDLGRCEPMCFRAADCRSSDFICNVNNHCELAPLGGSSDEGGAFQPGDYTVLFTQKLVSLTAVSDRYDIPLVIMDIKTRSQVMDRPEVRFGYRLELDYSSAFPKGSFCRWSQGQRPEGAGEEVEPPPPEDLAHCFFLTLPRPFGSVTAVGPASHEVRLNQAFVSRLPPGKYSVTLQAIYTNGTADTTVISFEKRRPSGTYAGQVAIYLPGEQRTKLADSVLGAELFISTVEKQWNELQREAGLPEGVPITEVTKGQYVYGTLDGATTPLFNNPQAQSVADNKVPVRGMYLPEQGGRLRLLAVIELPGCQSTGPNGVCTYTGTDPTDMSMANVFARRIRRILSFNGTLDSQRMRYSGVFRETIMGLKPGGASATADGSEPSDGDDSADGDDPESPVYADTLTLDGAFVLDLLQSTSKPIDVIDSEAEESFSATLLPDGAPTLVTYPSADDLLDAVVSVRTNQCAPGPTDTERFIDEADADAYRQAFRNALTAFGVSSASADSSAFQDYLAQIDGEQVGSRSGRVFSDLVTFSALIQGALDALGDSQSAALTLYDYLRETIFLCSESNQESCIDEKMTRCGLALYQEAILRGWMNIGGVGPASASGHELFCDDLSVSPDCGLAVEGRKNLVALQEHNRLYMALTQALRYQAGAHLSDAFFMMYQNAADPQGLATALSDKQAYTLKAWSRYDEILGLVFSPAMTSIFYSWPMSDFKSRGGLWTNMLQQLMADRVDALEMLVDLKRRVFLQASEQDEVFVAQLLQQEFLQHVWLARLQQDWQGSQFSYAGHAAEAMAVGQSILNRLDLKRNPLGFHPDQVFFENSNLARSNWQNYRDVLVAGGTSGRGMAGDVEALVDEAVLELRASLDTTYALESQLLQSKHGYEQQIDRICGSEEAYDGEHACTGTSAEDRAEALECGSRNCDFDFTCETVDCASLVAIRAGHLGGSVVAKSVKDLACYLDTPDLAITFGSSTRPCVRGQVAALLDQQRQLKLQLDQLVRRFDAIRLQSQLLGKEIRTASEEKREFVEKLWQATVELNGLNMWEGQTTLAHSTASLSGEAIGCLIIFGWAVGSNCPTRLVGSVISITAAILKAAADANIAAARQTIYAQKEELAFLHREEGVIRNLKLRHFELQDSILAVIDEYGLVVHQLYATGRRIEDELFVAQRAAQHYQENVSLAIDHLIGADQGSVLRRNAAVMQAEVKFQDLIDTAYRMVMAFVHNYGAVDDAQGLIGQVYAIVTPDGVRRLIEELETRQRQYCGGAAIDCDAANNIHTYRLSLRETLYPDLVDIIDSDAAVVYTKGEQFHDILMSQYKKRSVRGPMLINQLEVPFGIKLGSMSSPEWMVSPLECHHYVAGQGRGTVGISVVGARIDGVKVELQRGAIDWVRGCEQVPYIPPGGGVPVDDYPHYRFVVGYAPQSALAQEDAPPSYSVRSGGLAACINAAENSQRFITDENCYHYFARDRSLASNDWTLVIPLGIDGNESLDDDTLTASERPIIEDVLLYFRYRSRPTSEL